MRALMDDILSAFGLLTRLPLPLPGRGSHEASNLSRSV